MMNDEPQKRIDVVGSQYELECKVAKADIGEDTGERLAVAIFIVPSMATPFYLNPDDVYQDEADGLFKLQKGAEVPVGLIPADKLEKPAQLSTVLARVLSVRDMLDADVQVDIITLEKDRPRVDGCGTVEAVEGSLMERYEGKFRLFEVGQCFFNSVKNFVGAANYHYMKDGEFKTAAIFASQINRPNSNQTFDKLFGEEAVPFVADAVVALGALTECVGPRSSCKTCKSLSDSSPSRGPGG